MRDLRAGRDASFTGIATIAPDERRHDELLWHESGVLVGADHRGPASRTMRILRAGAAWEVLFADGRHFHNLDLRTGRCEVDHPCAPDAYHGVFVLRDQALLDVLWRIRGPAKRMEIFSRYSRIGS